MLQGLFCWPNYKNMNNLSSAQVWSCPIIKPADQKLKQVIKEMKELGQKIKQDKMITPTWMVQIPLKKYPYKQSTVVEVKILIMHNLAWLKNLNLESLLLQLSDSCTNTHLPRWKYQF